MTLKDFKRVINKAENRLKLMPSNGNTFYHPVCIALFDSYRIHYRYCKNGALDIYETFEYLFQPKRTKSAYWLGEINEKNLDKRKDYLRMFEQVCISEGYYHAFQESYKWK